jgi:uncharacterized protein (TIGR02270 family)
MSREAPIRWDLVEEHLDEAAFLRQLWEEALRSPLYTLEDVAGGPEGRMLAHLDGLVVAGRRAADRLLLPGLSADEPGVVFASAFALAASEDGDFGDAVVEALAKGEPARRAAIRRALSVAPVPGLGPRLAALAPASPLPLQADLLDILAYMRLDPGVRLEPLAASREPGALARAIRIAKAFPQRLDPQVISRALVSPDEEVRTAALETGMVAGVRGTLPAADDVVARRAPGFAQAALVVALSGEEKAVGALAPALADEALRAPAAFALGFTGRISAADALLAAMADEAFAPLAAEGFAAISGLPIERRFARQPLRWRPSFPGVAEEEEPYGPEADLAKPVPETIARWWGAARAGLDGSRRWLRGRPWSPEAILAELAAGPARRREALALELAVRTRGAAAVAVDALSARQRAELSSAASTLHPVAPWGDGPSVAPRAAPPPAPVAARSPACRASAIPPDAAAVTAIGLVTSLGESSAQVLAAARAGLVRPAPVEDVELAREQEGETYHPTCHLVAEAAGHTGLGRLVRLAELGLRSLERARTFGNGTKTGLFVATGSDALVDDADLGRELGLERLVPRLAEHVPALRGLAVHQVFPADSPGFAAALLAARTCLAEGRADQCVVGGVDSLADPAVLLAAARLGMLKTEEQPVGFMPGEAAAFLLLERGSDARRTRAPVKAWIETVAVAAEPPRPEGSPPAGRALARVVSEAAGSGPPPELMLTDLNGTTVRAQDWGTALTRLASRELRDAPQRYPAVHFGEIGAATGGVAVAMAAEAFERAVPPPRSAVVWLWSDRGDRAALRVEPP